MYVCIFIYIFIYIYTYIYTYIYIFPYLSTAVRRLLLFGKFPYLSTAVRRLITGPVSGGQIPLFVYRCA